MSLSSFLFLLIITPSVLCLSLVKLNESQKVGLPSFMYSHFNISDVSGVASVMQSFFNNFKDSISEYVEILSGSADVQESATEGVGVESERLGREEAERAKNVVKVEGSVKEETAKQEVEKKQVEVQQPKVVNTVQQKVKQEEKAQLPSENPKQTPNIEPKVVKTEQKTQNNVQKENNQNINKLPQQASPANANQPKKEPNIENKVNNAPPVKPSPNLKKTEDVKTHQNTNQKENVNKVNAKPAVQESKTATNPGLFSEEAKLVAARLESILTNLDQSLGQHLQKARASSEASQAVGQYNAAVKSAESTKCAPLGGESRLELVLETCVGSVLQLTKAGLEKSIGAAVEKVKDLDYNLRLTSDLCSSLKEPPSEVCEEAKKKSVDSLGNVVSQLEVERLGEQAIRDVESCVEQQTGHLISLTKQINDCRADGQEL